MFKKVLVITLFAALVSSGVLSADDEQLKKDVEQLKQEVEQLKKQQGGDVRLSLDKGFRVESADGRLALEFGGRLLGDWAWIKEDDDTRRVIGNQEDGTEFRAARLHIAGTLYKTIDFKTEYDFVGGDADFKDVWMGMKLPVVGYLKIGHHKEPMGLDLLTSRLAMTFMERAAAGTIFGPDRDTGVSLSKAELDERMTWSAGVFRDSDDYGDSEGDGEYAVTARVTGLPWYEEKGARLLHLGGAYSRRSPKDDTIRLRERPEIHLADRYVDTGALAADAVDLFGLEAAVVVGPFSLQGEYMAAGTDAPSGGEDLNFDGYYLHASWFLTGEHREYKTKSGLFDRVKPLKNFSIVEGGWGAWEVALRYSNVDLVDGPVNGGELSNVAGGLNWYLFPNVRIMMNYIRADLDDRGAAGSVGATNAFMMRLQIDF